MNVSRREPGTWASSIKMLVVIIIIPLYPLNSLVIFPLGKAFLIHMSGFLPCLFSHVLIFYSILWNDTINKLHREWSWWREQSHQQLSIHTAQSFIEYIVQDSGDTAGTKQSWHSSWGDQQWRHEWLRDVSTGEKGYEETYSHMRTQVDWGSYVRWVGQEKPLRPAQNSGVSEGTASREEHAREREQHVQRPWGWSVLSAGGQCGSSGVGEGES